MLANLFLHYAFDAWMAREFPSVRFERYVDDAVVHCVSERQARQVLADLAKGRMRAKIPDLARALEGRFGDHHALMCRLHL